jgi:hypothetical protein
LEFLFPLAFSVGSERETPFLPRRAKACQYFFEISLKNFGLPGFTVPDAAAPNIHLSVCDDFFVISARRRSFALAFVMRL